MPVQLELRTIFRALTVRRVELLRELADGRTQREIGVALGIATPTVRQHVAQLVAITGCSKGRETGRWWRAHRREWLEFLSEISGAADTA
jgi:DNA-binding CsgD family transcriptional regulator